MKFLTLLFTLLCIGSFASNVQGNGPDDSQKPSLDVPEASENLLHKLFPSTKGEIVGAEKAMVGLVVTAAAGYGMYKGGRALYTLVKNRYAARKSSNLP